MANVDNINRAIEVMNNVPVDKFDIRDWFGECGTVACFAGHLALSPDIPEITVEDVDIFGEYELINFLGLKECDVINLCGIFNSVDNDGELYDEFYMKPSSAVTPKDVVEKLKTFL